MALGSGLAITQQMGQSIIMPQTLRLAGSYAVAHVTSRDTPRPPLFRDDDGWPRLRAIPGPVVGYEEVGVAGVKIWCWIARPDPKILFQVLPMAVASNLFGEVIHARAATTA